MRRFFTSAQFLSALILAAFAISQPLSSESFEESGPLCSAQRKTVLCHSLLIQRGTSVLYKSVFRNPAPDKNLIQTKTLVFAWATIDAAQDHAEQQGSSFLFSLLGAQHDRAPPIARC